MRRADTLGTLRSMLTCSVTVDEALFAYLGRSLRETDQHADEDRTADGMLMARLRDLVTILALREAPSSLAMLTAAVLWRSAPVASSVDELREAIQRICLWRAGIDDTDFSRIIQAHRLCTMRLDAALTEADGSCKPGMDAATEELAETSHGDTVVAELGSSLLIVTMTDCGFLVGIQDADDVVTMIDRIPH